MLVGVNLSHDYAHCLLDDGKLTVVEEERWSRQRYHPDASAYTLMCLDRYDEQQLRDLDAIVLNSPHVAEIARRNGDLSSRDRAYRYVGGYPQREADVAVWQGELHIGDLVIPAGWASHYHAHAISSYWATPFAEADVLCLDGGGDFGEGAIFTGRDGEIRLVERLLDVQLGSSYHHFSLRVFQAADGFFESKVMAIASYGDPELSDSSFLSRRGTLVAIDAAIRPSVHDVAEFQLRFEEGVMAILENMERTAPALCVSGGCFYNVPLNRRIAESGLYEEVFVPPHVGDMGTAVGAVMLAAQMTGGAMPAPAHAASPYLGAEIGASREHLDEIIGDLGDIAVFHGLDSDFV